MSVSPSPLSSVMFPSSSVGDEVTPGELCPALRLLQEGGGLTDVVDVATATSHPPASPSARSDRSLSNKLSVRTLLPIDIVSDAHTPLQSSPTSSHFIPSSNTSTANLIPSDTPQSQSLSLPLSRTSSSSAFSSTSWNHVHRSPSPSTSSYAAAAASHRLSHHLLARPSSRLSEPIGGYS